MNSLFGFKVIESLVAPSDLPRITFDPQHKCDAWATPDFRRQMDAWLLKRFGTQRVAFMFNQRALGLAGFTSGPTVVMNPQNAVMLRDFQ